MSGKSINNCIDSNKRTEYITIYKVLSEYIPIRTPFIKLLKSVIIFSFTRMNPFCLFREEENAKISERMLEVWIFRIKSITNYFQFQIVIT